MNKNEFVYNPLNGRHTEQETVRQAQRVGTTTGNDTWIALPDD